MKHTLSVLVENRPGVLSKVAGLFSRRAFNIDSLAVGVTQDPSVSRITIVVNDDECATEQVEKQLNKLIDVIKVKTLPYGQYISRELVLLKVACNASNRGEIIQIADIFEAKIVDVTHDTLTLEVSGSSSRLASLESMLTPYGIREIARTGPIALEKGAQDITSGKKSAEESSIS